MLRKRYLAGATVTAALLIAGPSDPGKPVAHAMGVVRNGDVVLGFETFGVSSARLPIIAVNGGPGLSHAYMLQNDMWQQVARRGLVIFYDQRGTGASKKVPADSPQTMDAQVADLEAIRAHFAVDRFALLGDSYGGLLAMAYGAAHPEHIGKLILSDSAAPAWNQIVHLLPQTFPDVEEQNAAAADRLGRNTDEAARASLRNHFRMIFYSPSKRDAYLATMGDLGYEPAVAKAVSNATKDLDLTQKLPAFRFPTLVITGRFDLNVAPLTAWKMAHTIPGAELVFFEQSGHLPSYEEPAKYRAVLESFLDAR